MGDADVTREPKGRRGRKSRKDEDATTEAPEDDLELRRNLRKGGKRRGGRGDSDSTREPKDSTAEPRDDCKDRRKRKDRGDSSDDSSDDSATTAIPLRRLLREKTERAVDATKEP